MIYLYACTGGIVVLDRNYPDIRIITLVWVSKNGFGAAGGVCRVVVIFVVALDCVVLAVVVVVNSETVVDILPDELLIGLSSV